MKLSDPIFSEADARQINELVKRLSAVLENTFTDIQASVERLRDGFIAMGQGISKFVNVNDDFFKSLARKRSGTRHYVRMFGGNLPAERKVKNVFRL